MIRFFALMATVAMLTGTSTPSDIWTFPPEPTTAVSTAVHGSDAPVSAEAPVPEPPSAVRACVTVFLEEVDGSQKIVEKVYVGVEPNDLRADVVGRYLVFELDPPAGPAVSSLDRLLGSVNIVGLSEYTLCR